LLWGLGPRDPAAILHSLRRWSEVLASKYVPSLASYNPLTNSGKRSLEKHFKRLSVVFSRTLASAGKELKDNFLKALAEREEANRSGKMTSVIFIRDYNTLGQEVSGYIDYTHRLKTQDFEPYFCGKKRLMPGPSDLCYYNWKTQTSTSNSSPNFEVIYDDPNGLLFKSKRDKTIRVVWFQSRSSGTLLQSDLYVHVMLYDRSVRMF
uniref:Cilia- and flagella-associated protein 299 n=1 Tax=Poecilia latipinna TaxID=48699 RepID=A0A3B3UJ29_9TELE